MSAHDQPSSDRLLDGGVLDAIRQPAQGADRRERVGRVVGEGRLGGNHRFVNRS